MKRILTLTTLLTSSLLILTACTAPITISPTARAIPDNTPTATASLTPTQTATLMPTATTTPTPTLPSPQSTDHQLPAVYPVAPPPGAVAQLGYGAVFVKYVSPDGQKLAVGTASGVGLYRLPDLDMIWFTPTDFTVNKLVWSPDSTKIVVSTVNSRRPFGALIDAQTGRIRRKITEHTREIFTIDWTGDSRFFLTGGSDGALLMWNADSGQIRHRLIDPWKKQVYSDNYSSFNADGTLIATYFYSQGCDASPYSHFLVWDTASGEQLYRHTGDDGDLFASLTWHPHNPNWLLIISPLPGWETYELSIFDAVSQEKLVRTEFPGNPFTFPKGYWSPDASLVYGLGVAGGIDENLLIMDAMTLSTLYELPYPFPYSHEIIFIDDLMFTREKPDYYGPETYPHLWDSRTGEEVESWNNIKFTEYDDNLLYGIDQSTGEEILMELPTRTFLDPQAVQAITGQWRSGNLAWSPDSSQLAIGHSQGMTLWDVNSHAPLYNCCSETYSTESIGSVASVDKWFGPVSASVAWTDDTLVIADHYQMRYQRLPTLTLWTPAGSERYLVPEEIDYISDIAVSPDGRLVALGGMAPVRFDLMTKEFFIVDSAVLQQPNFHWVHQIEFSPDGRYVIGPDWSGYSPVIWDMDTGQVAQTTWSGDYSAGDELPTVTFLRENQLITYAVPSGEVVEQLDLPLYPDNGQLYEITSVAVQDNILAVAYSLELSYSDPPPADYPGDPIVLWDLASGQLIQSYSGHNSRIVDLAFSPDGNLLASTSFDGVIIIWPVP